MDWQDKIAVSNYGLTAILMYVGFIAALRVYPKVHGDARRLVRGLGMEALGWGLHQTYWFTRWWFLAKEDMIATQWFLDHSWALSGVYWFLIHLGAIKIAYALYRDNCLMHMSWARKGQTPFVSGISMWVVGMVVLWLVIYSSIS